MTDISPPTADRPDAPAGAPPDLVRRAAVVVLERAGPLPPWRLVTLLGAADLDIGVEDLDRLVAQGVLVRVQGPGAGDLLALPARAVATDWRSVVAGQPPAVLVAVTVTVLLVLVLVLMAVNGPDASWPAIEWAPPGG